MNQPRPAIPAGIKREVRQRAGFGCVICGVPLTEYDHLEPWSEVQVHEASNIVALCTQHHREKTNKLLTVARIRRANTNPWNKRDGRTKPYILHYGDDPITVEFGTVTFHTFPVERCVPLTVDGEEIVSWRVEDGVYLLSARWFDSNGNLVFEITDNEVAVNAHSWDVEFVGNHLTIRSGSGKVQLDVLFDVPKRVVFRSGEFALGRHRVAIRSGALVINGNSVYDMESRSPWGISVGRIPEGQMTLMSFDNPD